jgi:hypothetical protein
VNWSWFRVGQMDGTEEKRAFLSFSRLSCLSVWLGSGPQSSSAGARSWVVLLLETLGTRDAEIVRWVVTFVAGCEATGRPGH